MQNRLIDLIQNSSPEVVEKMIVDGLRMSNRIRIPIGISKMEEGRLMDMFCPDPELDKLPNKDIIDKVVSFVDRTNYKMETVSEPILEGKNLNYVLYLEIYR